jgi:hypothetical protein
VTYWKRKPLEAAEQRAEQSIALPPAVLFVGRDEDEDARDPRSTLPNGTWAPRGPTVRVRDLDEWLGK